MTEEEYKQMLADREAGTQGEFEATQDRGLTLFVAKKNDHDSILAEVLTHNGADCKRFARVPEMEAEIIRLRAEVTELKKATNQSRLAFAGMVSVQSAIDLLDTLKGETNG